MVERRSTAVIGGGWAGLAAAVEATRLGDAVTLYEMAPLLGGRARSVGLPMGTVDNGQHIAIGAYRATLQLLASLGIAEADAFHRIPLTLVDASGRGLRLPGGPPVVAFARGVLANRHWPWPARLALLRGAAGWLLADFRCAPTLTVEAMTRSWPRVLHEELIEPLCVAALNTPATRASAQVFLRVLHDALFGGAGSCDLLLPRQPLGALLPEPAARWLVGRGAALRLATRVTSLQRGANGGSTAWLVDDTPFDRVILATSATEAARLAAPFAAEWSAVALALAHEAIVTVYLRSSGSFLPCPMLMLRSDEEHPAQFAFDRGQLGGPPGLFAFVVSGANAWTGRQHEVEQAVIVQAERQLGAHWRAPLEGIQVITEKRATFACTPGLKRPSRDIAPGLTAAGDHVDGPYPATLEGAVQSGLAAARC